MGMCSVGRLLHLVGCNLDHGQRAGGVSVQSTISVRVPASVCPAHGGAGTWGMEIWETHESHQVFVFLPGRSGTVIIC